MRLDILEHGHRRPAQILQRVAALLLRVEMDDVTKTAMHRPEFFGRWLLDYASEVLRGPSFWTAGEREYLAMTTSRLNECPFCATVHTETTRVESRGELVSDDLSTLRPQLIAVRDLVIKLTRSPDQVTAADVESVRAAGVPDDAIIDALHVNLIFNLANRLANAFAWSWDSDTQVRKAAKVIHLSRYKLPRFAMR
jgi:uncharacterized peroxidase-related enzyme